MHLPEKWLQDPFTGWELGSPVPPFFPPLLDGLDISGWPSAELYVKLFQANIEGNFRQSCGKSKGEGG